MSVCTWEEYKAMFPPDHPCLPTFDLDKHVELEGLCYCRECRERMTAEYDRMWLDGLID
jgi:hypothetical protein